MKQVMNSFVVPNLFLNWWWLSKKAEKKKIHKKKPDFYNNPRDKKYMYFF